MPGIDVDMTADPRSQAGTDLRSRAAGLLLRIVNPITRRMIPAGIPTGAPNVLLTVRGRRTGRPRAVPVGMIVVDRAWFVQATYGQTGWVANLRAAGEATVTRPGGTRIPVRAIELSPEDAGAVLQRVLQPYRRSRLLRLLIGPDFRPPIGVLSRLRLRVDDSLEEYVAEARRHPVFELRPVATGVG